MKIVNLVFDGFIDALKNGDRIEIRGFGSFRVREYKDYKQESQDWEGYRGETEEIAVFQGGDKIEKERGWLRQGARILITDNTFGMAVNP